MILKTTLSTLTIGLLAVAPAFAHSEYWECAAASGSNEAAAANCGSRADYDATGHLGGANAPSQAQLDQERRQQEQQREEQQREEDQRRRDDEVRRQQDDDRRRHDQQEEDDRRRRQQEEEDAQNRSSYSNSNGGYYAPAHHAGHVAHPAHPAPRPATHTQVPAKPHASASVVVDEPTAADDIVIPVEINQQVASLNVGVAANLDQYDGLRIKSIKVETSTTGNSRVDVFVAGARVGGIKAELPGEYEKDFVPARAVIRSIQRNLVLNTAGDVTILRVTVIVGK